MDINDPETTVSEVAALGPDWGSYYYCVARVRGGPFDGLRVVGAASNKKIRVRTAHMAVAAACLARNRAPQLSGYTEAIRVAVTRLMQWWAFVVSHAAWPKEHWRHRGSPSAGSQARVQPKALPALLGAPKAPPALSTQISCI